MNDLEKEFERRRLEDQDAMRDSRRKMAWFALFGMLIYPICVITTSALGMTEGATILGNMAPTYFVSVAGIVAAFYGFEYKDKPKPPPPADTGD